jgi:urease accessory protein
MNVNINARFLAPLALFAAIAVVLADQPAQAHGFAAGGITGGFLHPLTGTDHLLLLISVGAAASYISSQLLLWGLVGGIAGGVFGAMGGGAASLWWLGAFSGSLLVSGGTFAVMRRLPAHWAANLALVLAVLGRLLVMGPVGLLMR